MNALRPGDQQPFIEGWKDLRRLPAGYDLEHITMESLCRLLDLARMALDEIGWSYRAFKVGCAILALDEPGQRLGTYFGGNFTPYDGAPWNCAEKRGLEKIEQLGYTRVLALAVCGPVQEDRSGWKSPTLHPCDKCRQMMDNSPTVSQETLIGTVTPSADAYELFTLDSLLKTHQEQRYQGFPKYNFMLPFYWQQILSQDLEADREETALLDLIARGVNPKIS